MLLDVSRSSRYYRPKGESTENLAFMRRMDELRMEKPFYGSRQMMRHLRLEGVMAGRLRIRQLMRVSQAHALPAGRVPFPPSRAHPGVRLFFL